MLRRLRALPWKQIGYSVISLCCLAGLVILMSAVSVKSSEQACLQLNVLILGDESFVEQKDVISFVEGKYGALVGRTLASIPTHEIEADLRAIPHVLQAVVYADVNGQLNIRIQQRKAVIRIFNLGGASYYIDEMGLKIPVSATYVPRVLVANGYIREPFGEVLDSMQTDIVKDLYATADFIRKDSLWSNQIVQLYINENQEIELVPRVGEQQIILGDTHDLEDKFKKLQLFYTRIVPKTGIHAYKTVNLKYANQLVCERQGSFRLEDLYAQLDSLHVDSTKGEDTTLTN
jgi:cell division protein FtsQ